MWRGNSLLCGHVEVRTQPGLADGLSICVREVDQERRPWGSEDKVKRENSLIYSYF